MRNSLLTAALLLGASSWAATAHDMIPAAQQTQSILLKNGTLHTVANGVQANTDLLLQAGKITAIGKNLRAEGAEVIDVSGKHLYPGLLALDTTLGLVEISAVRSTNDDEDVGTDNPQLQAAAAYNPDSELIPTVRANGIAYAQIVPRGDGLAGQSALVNLDSWTIEDAEHQAAVQIHLNWPTMRRWGVDSDEQKAKAKAAYEQKIADIDQHFESAYRYALAAKAQQIKTPDERWQAMLPLFDGSGKLFVHADKQQTIEDAAALCKKYGFKLVIVGGYDAWRSADILNEMQASVVYTHMLDLPERADEPIGQAFKIPALLKAAGIPFAIGFSDNWDSRNLPLAAAQTVAWGLNQDEALRAITLDAAQIAGANNIGALAVGYDATIAVSSGDILDPAFGKVEALYIDGRKVDLNNRHRQLYHKYLTR
ncbi:amidohydrolase [Shewanella avicenniae]|uniref:Amidohydrolase n=1 Tax=Shewanella avicenniae TaxID=2814294 RepID=A0ABX7QQ16_9GAMM|nr:amidohydrolase [Shewanella avicenniae]QSX32795.1 amidohydrolase [Shewanella avicenniae]